MRLALSIAAAGAGLAFLAASGLGAPSQAPTSAGVFRYSLAEDIDYVDPALAYYAPTWEILYSTCSMLVNYPDAPAPRGARLVPDGAAAMPTVSRDGRTYTFQVRRGQRFSDGTPITARNYARALHRVLHPNFESPGRPFYSDIVGAQTYFAGRTRRIEGVTLLPRNRLRILLTRRAPDLLARLALPFACAVKAGLPVVFEGVRPPLVGSGPYFVADWEPRRRIVLRRNRFYRGPRPRNVGTVLYDIGLPLSTIKLKVDAGETDHGLVPPAAHAELGRQYGARRSSPGRYFVNPTGGVRYLAFNHERELFGKPGGGRGAGLGNVRLKQAVNFAIDRVAMVQQHGAYAGLVHDQYLPPTIPGFRAAAIYPPRPDLGRARALAEGQTRSVEGSFLRCRPSNPCVPIAEIVQENLRQIGLEMEIYQDYYQPPRAHRTRGHPLDLVQEVWSAPYFDPYGYLFLLDGRKIVPRDNTNVSYFFSPAYIRKLVRAASLEGQARYHALGALDVDLAKNVAPLATYMVDNDRRYFSARVRGFFSHPVYGLDLAAIRVR